MIVSLSQFLTIEYGTRCHKPKATADTVKDVSTLLLLHVNTYVRGPIGKRYPVTQVRAYFSFQQPESSV